MLIDDGHYNKLADNYDKSYEMYHRATVNFIKQNIPLSETDQIVDIGAGTGEVAHRLVDQFGLKLPPICVEPNENMLQVASQKGGIIPVLATAEEFLAQEHNLSAKIIMLASMLHYIKDVPATLKKLAAYIKPMDDACVIIRYPYPQEIWLTDICDSLGLHCKMVEFKEHVEMEKEVWYEALRQRYVSTLIQFSDVEIEEGICELEDKLKSTKVLNFDFHVKGWIIKHL